MNSNKDSRRRLTGKFSTPPQQQAVKIVDALYTFLARTELYSTEAQKIALEQIQKNVPMDAIEERFMKAAETYIKALIAEYAGD